MFTKRFWRQALERATKTAAQAVVAVLVADGANVLTLDWAVVGGAVLTGAVLSLLTSLVSLPLGEPDSPSVVAE